MLEKWRDFLESVAALAVLPAWLKLAWLAWLPITGLLIYLTARYLHPLNQTEEPPSAPKSHQEDPITAKEKSMVVDKIWIVTIAHGTDQQGRTAIFKIMVLSRDFSWEYESAEFIEYRGVRADFKEHLQTPGMKANLSRSKALFAVGASSEEGDHQEKEELRAKDRAERLQLWLKEYVEGAPQLYTLNLGQFRNIASPDQFKRRDLTAPQRRVVILGAIESDEGVSYEEALRSALQKEPAFPFPLDSYSLFDVKEWR